jgi:uncharacterized LabA/DUF88 family protein
MGISSGPYTGPKEIHYLFIDGGCLRDMLSRVSETYFNGDEVTLDYSVLSSYGGGFSKIFYYDALPPKKTDESDEVYERRLEVKQAFFNHLRSINGYHVYEGVSRRRRKIVEQKEVDILIAVDMLTHSFRGNMHKATLLTGDLDFRPLIEALVREGMYVTLWYPHGRPNQELLYAADSLFPLTPQTIFSWCTKDFQENHSFPQTGSAPGKNSEGMCMVGNWTPETGPECEIYQYEAGFRLVFPSGHSDHYTAVVHSDLDIAKRFAQDCFPQFWKAPI